MESASSKEKFLIYNTLACIPTVLRDKSVLIDLRNETSVAGRILNADGFMNIHLTDAVFIDRHGLQYSFDEFIVKKRFIRQIHIPESIDVMAKVTALVDKSGNRVKRQKKRTYAQKRVITRHAEVLEAISKQKEV